MKTYVDRRNPYLVLGIPYGASKREVRRAFAERSKRIRRGEFDAVRTEDLNWALHRLEQVEQDADIDLEYYRVPANNALIHDGPLSDSAHGFFNPEPAPLARRTNPLSSNERQNLADQAVIEWLRAFFAPGGEPIRIPYPHPEP